MKKFIFFIIALAIIIITAAILYWPSKEIPTQEIGKVFLVVGDKNFEFDYEPEITAFALLEKSELSLETKQYDFGILIESIDSVKNGQDNKYWIYYVDGKAAVAAADKVKLSPGDVVEFKFEESPF